MAAGSRVCGRGIAQVQDREASQSIDLPPGPLHLPLMPIAPDAHARQKFRLCILAALLPTTSNDVLIARFHSPRHLCQLGKHHGPEKMLRGLVAAPGLALPGPPGGCQGRRQEPDGQ